MKKSLVIFVCFLIIGVCLAVYIQSSPTKSDVSRVGEGSVLIDTEKYAQRQVSIKGVDFSVFVSDTPLLRNQGLSGFKGLLKNEGMLFVFDVPDNVGFWMKDMLFPIDIVWIDSDMKVVSFKENVSPDTFPQILYPNTPALYVLEVTAGTVSSLGLQKGDKVFISGGK